MEDNKYLKIIKKQQELINLLLTLDDTELKSVSVDVPENVPMADIKDIPETKYTRENYSEQEFRNYLESKGMLENSIHSYTQTLKLYFRDFDSITNENLAEWEAEKRKEYSPKTMNLRIVGLQRYFEFIGFSGYEFKKSKVQQKTFCDNAINEQQYNQLIEWAKVNSSQVYKIAKIIGSTGVRVSELIRLKTADLDKGYVDITSKGNKTRRIYFPQTLIDGIKPLCNGEYLIMNRYGQPMTTRGVAQLLIAAGQKVGIPKEVMHPHSFRHFFAKQFLKHNNDITLLGDLLGHSNISTTAIYTRMTSEEQQNELNKIINW